MLGYMGTKIILYTACTIYHPADAPVERLTHSETVRKFIHRYMSLAIIAVPNGMNQNYVFCRKDKLCRIIQKPKAPQHV